MSYFNKGFRYNSRFKGLKCQMLRLIEFRRKESREQLHSLLHDFN